MTSPQEIVRLARRFAKELGSPRAVYDNDLRFRGYCFSDGTFVRVNRVPVATQLAREIGGSIRTVGNRRAVVAAIRALKVA